MKANNGNTRSAAVLGMATIMMLAPGLAAPALAEDKPSDAGGGAVLDTRGYWRVYSRFGPDQISPAALAADGDKTLNPKWIERKKKEFDNWCRSNGQDPAKLDWKDSVFNDANGLVTVHPAPPENWMSPDFDDSAWLKVKDATTSGCTRRRACFLRARFDVPDPTKPLGPLSGTGELTVKLSCRGGARVFVNGQELVRGHLPEGALTPDTPAMDYPAAAYVLLPDEWPPHWKGKLKPEDWLRTPLFCPELPARFEEAPVARPGQADQPEFRGVGWGTGTERVFTRAIWERVGKLRNREIGPVKIPAKMLRAGSNVLAIEIRTSRMHPVVLNLNPRDSRGWGWDCLYSDFSWPHGGLQSVELRSATGAVPSGLSRPEGMQVWVEDIHYRVHGPEFLPRGEPAGTIRIVGVPNGTHSAQIVIGSTKPLAAPRITLSDLQPFVGGQLTGAPGGAPVAGKHPVQGLSVAETRKLSPGDPIPAAAGRAFFMTARPLTELGPLNHNRGTFHPGFVGRMGRVGLARHAGSPLPYLPDGQLAKELEKMTYFDQLGESVPEQIAADGRGPQSRYTAIGDPGQAVWLSWKVPAGARPGKYKGSVRVEAQGLAPVSLPVELEVCGWRLPDSKDFQTIVAIEQSPYGVAKQYKTALWSDEHFKRLEASIRQLGRAGNDLLIIPARSDMDFGNGPDTIVRWIRKKDPGAPGLTFDYAALDRYLDLVAKYWGPPRFVCFEVLTSGDPSDVAAPVRVLDETTGQTVLQPLGGPAVPDGEHKKLWTTFAQSLRDHLKSKGLAKSLYWWYGYDGGFDVKLRTVLAEAVPEVYFVLSSHALDGVGGGRARVFEFIYSSSDRAGTGRGWKTQPIRLSTPRWGNTVYCVDGDSNPFAFRVAMERMLSYGYNGSGRMAGDYWGTNFFNVQKWVYQPGFSVGDLLYPGREGAESSARFEAFLEGIQEAEARIFIEQAVDRGGLPKELAERAERTLLRHSQYLSFLPPGAAGAYFPENEYHYGWQDRSRETFQLAAEVSAVVPPVKIAQNAAK